MQGLRTAWMLALLPGCAWAGSVVTTADFGLGSDDNIQVARNGLPRSAEQFVQMGLAAALSEPLDAGLSLRVQARLDARVQAQYQGLNELAGGLEGQLLLRPGQGFYTPILGLSMGVGASQFQSDLRDAQEARLGLLAREALTTRLTARSRLFAVWRGSDSRAFDAHMKGGELALDWQATPPLTLTLAYQYRDGTVVSIGVPGASALANTRAVEADDVFAGQSAFSFPAQTHIGLAGANYAITPSLSLDAQLRYVESDTDFGIRYHRWTTITGLIARF
ncbi:MAG: hypothetical protein Q7J29_05435 [Stagnimonas sp.]|nr:hypothetical protein [Stagnimonas sp.]